MNENTAVAETKSQEVSAILTAEQFSKMINSKPRKDWVRMNPYSDNAFYIPIGIVEELLNKIFPIWQVEQQGQPQILGNSIVVSVHLKVFHPVFNQWLSYAGVGAVPIEVKKGANPLDFTQINAKAMHKNVPSALSFAISNASKKIGKVFGSHLNRENQEI